MKILTLFLAFITLEILPTIVYAAPWMNTGSGVFDYVFEFGMFVAAVIGSFWLITNSYSEWKVRRRNKEKHWHLIRSGEYDFFSFFLDLLPAIILSIPFIFIAGLISKLFGGFENPGELIFVIYIITFIILVFFRTN